LNGDWILGNKKVDYIRGKSKYPMATYKIIHTYIAKDKKHRVVVEKVEE
jgi:hypothetical protein